MLLAQALFGGPDALLLDEPTNHLDLESIHWLQDFMIRYQGTLIVISHDRHFLNSVCTHIADIDYQTIITYTGGYDDMVLAKTQIRSRIEVAERAAGKEDRAAQRIHRAVFGRYAIEPGDFAQEGSGAAADERSGEVEYRAAVHPFRYEAAFGTASAGNSRASRSHTATRRSSGISRPAFRAARRSACIGRNGVGKTTLLRSLIANAPGADDEPFAIDSGIGRMGPRSRGRISSRRTTARRFSPA